MEITELLEAQTRMIVDLEGRVSMLEELAVLQNIENNIVVAFAVELASEVLDDEEELNDVLRRTGTFLASSMQEGIKGYLEETKITNPTLDMAVSSGHTLVEASLAGFRQKILKNWKKTKSPVG